MSLIRWNLTFRIRGPTFLIRWNRMSLIRWNLTFLIRWNLTFLIRWNLTFLIRPAKRPQEVIH